MINSIPKVTTDSQNVFDNVILKKRLPDTYWLMPKTQDNEQNDSYNESILPIPIMLPEEAKKTHNLKIIGTSIAGVTILTAAAVVFFLKGGPKGMIKSFGKLRDYLQKKVQNAKLDYENNTTTEKVYTYIIGKLDTILKKSEAVNNFTSIKDIAFKHLMYTTKFTRKIHDKTTKLFEKLCRNTVVKSYNGTKNKFRDTTFAIEEITENIVKGNPKLSKDLSDAEKISNDIMETYKTYFGSTARQNRYLKVKKDAASLKEKLNTIRRFISKDTMNEFVAESIIAKDKSEIQKMVNSHRKELSYTISDLTSESEKILLEITKTTDTKETEKLAQIKNIRTLLRQIRKNNKLDTQAKSEILDALKNLREPIMQNPELMDSEKAKYFVQKSTELSDLLANYKQGKVEDLLNLCQKTLPQKDYKQIEKMCKNSVKSLDKSIKIETEEFISKVRDLTLGSAPTDILTILSSLATLGYYLATSDDKDQRQSILLKYGIPALSGIGVSLYGNAKLFAGTKSLFFGALSMFIVNKIGSQADELLKKYQNKTHPKENENTAPKEIKPEEENQPKTV